MNRNEMLDQESIKKEIESLDDLRTYLSHSSNEPEEYGFIKSDNAFTKKARLLQSVRRWQTGAECGFIQKDGITYYHPNLAKDGQTTGCNFLSPDIFQNACKRIKDKKSYETIREDRLFNNFLSSQPMAFNLFFPLMKIVNNDDGKRRLATIVSNLLDKNNRLNIEKITEVGIEFIPDYWEKCLHDKTAMDACFRYITNDGKKGIIAIETKYTDQLGTNQASNPQLAIDAATEPNNGISELFTDEGKEKIRQGEVKLTQVYRNFLLTEKVRRYEKLDESLSIVVAPKDNVSNKKDEKELSDILKDEYKYKFQVISLEALVGALIEGFPDEEIFRKFHHRYLDFRTAEWLMKQ